MIIHLKSGADEQLIAELSQEINAFRLISFGKDTLVCSSVIKEIPDRYTSIIDSWVAFPNDMQLANIDYTNSKREIDLGFGKIGGNTSNTAVIMGPCAVESMEQITQSAELIKSLGLSVLRAGSFKPRTSPYSFQGLGHKGLEHLDIIRHEYGLKIITEVKDASHVDDIIAFADIIQIGAKAMYDNAILKKCSKTDKPVLIKRGFGTKLQEFVQAAEYILSGGNENVILCERGIRTFETKTRFSLDLCGAAYLKEYTNLPIVLDPSHALGFAYGVPDLARASMAMGVDGLLIEVHPNPAHAKSDAAQQLDHDTFKDLFESLKKIAGALNRNII
jgi:3-deoxy-7-phosphoheptulonate synthase